MFDSTMELIEKVQLGEDSLFSLMDEFDSDESVRGEYQESIADTLSAHANCRGGVSLIGVDKTTRKIIGIPSDQLDSVEHLIRESCTQSIVPPLTPSIHRYCLPAAEGGEAIIIKIEIARGLFLHSSPGGYLQRFGDRTQAIPSDYVARFLHTCSNHFDIQSVPDARITDLLPTFGKWFRPVRGNDLPAELFVKLGMAHPDYFGILRPTVASVLMASEDPRRWIPNAYIQAVAYRGDTIHTATAGAYQLDAADISGPLDRQIVDACQFVTKNMKMAAIKDQGRGDRPQYDMSAVFEAVVNAVAHRDYSIHGSKIRLRLFENRLELYSPGTIANSMTIESMAYLQSARNDVLCSLLAKCLVPDKPWLQTDRRTIMDKRGEGVPIILDNSLKLSGKEPEYRLIDDAELMLTIYAADLS